MNDDKPPEGDIGEQIVYAVVLGSPCLAAAISVAVLIFLSHVGALTWGSELPAAVALVNAVLAAGGSGIGGLFVRGTLGYRMSAAAMYGICALVAYAAFLGCAGVIR